MYFKNIANRVHVVFFEEVAPTWLYNKIVYGPSVGLVKGFLFQYLYPTYPTYSYIQVYIHIFTIVAIRLYFDPLYFLVVKSAVVKNHADDSEISCAPTSTTGKP